MMLPTKRHITESSFIELSDSDEKEDDCEKAITAHILLREESEADELDGLDKLKKFRPKKSRKVRKDPPPPPLIPPLPLHNIMPAQEAEYILPDVPVYPNSGNPIVLHQNVLLPMENSAPYALIAVPMPYMPPSQGQVYLDQFNSVKPIHIEDSGRPEAPTTSTQTKTKTKDWHEMCQIDKIMSCSGGNTQMLTIETFAEIANSIKDTSANPNKQKRKKS